MQVLGLYVLFAPIVCALALLLVCNRHVRGARREAYDGLNTHGALDLDRQLSTLEFRA